MVHSNAVSQSGSKPTAHKAKISTSSSSSRIRGSSSSMSSHHHHHHHLHHTTASSRSSVLKASGSHGHPSASSSRYIAEEMDQQRQDHGSNDIRHHDQHEEDGGREGSPADDEVRDEFPLESYLGGGRHSLSSSSVPVLSNQGLLPYPNTNEAAITAAAVAATTAAAAANNNAPGLEGDLNNLIIDSQNSWDVLNQNDSFGFDFNKGGEMSLSFESHDYNVLDSTAVTESMDGDTTTAPPQLHQNNNDDQQEIDWANVAPQLDMHGNLIPPTSTTSSSGRMMGGFDHASPRYNNHHHHHHHHHRHPPPLHHDNGQSYHHLVEMGGGTTAGEDPFAYAFGGGGPNTTSIESNTKKKSTSRKGRKGGATGGGGGPNGKKKKGGRGGGGAKSKKGQQQRDHFNMGPNPVQSFYSGNGNYGDLPQLVSSSYDGHQGGYNMPSSSDYRPPPYHPSHSSKGGSGGRSAATRPSCSGTALLTTESGIVLTREQAPGIGWPPNEDKALQEVMSRHKSPINWEVIAKEMNFGRLARECHDRWTRYLKPGTRKGQWKEEEDAIVLRVIATSSEHPFTQWADLAPLLPGRSGKQIRDRWVNYLNPAINHLPFSREDDLKLWAGHRDLGKRWVEISVKIFNSTRSENHIKNRWYSAAFKKFIANEFGNCAYVDASPSFGSSNSKDAVTTTVGARMGV